MQIDSYRRDLDRVRNHATYVLLDREIIRLETELAVGVTRRDIENEKLVEDLMLLVMKYMKDDASGHDVAMKRAEILKRMS